MCCVCFIFKVGVIMFDMKSIHVKSILLAKLFCLSYLSVPILTVPRLAFIFYFQEYIALNSPYNLKTSFFIFLKITLCTLHFFLISLIFIIIYNLSYYTTHNIIVRFIYN